MMLLAKRSVLALAAVIDIALHARPEPVAARALAERLALPPRHLEPLLQALVRAGILRGVRGPKGGYELARERRRITVAEVLRASLFEVEEEREAAPSLVTKVVRPLAMEISARLIGELETITVRDLCESAQTSGATSPVADPADFTI